MGKLKDLAIEADSCEVSNEKENEKTLAAREIVERLSAINTKSKNFKKKKKDGKPTATQLPETDTVLNLHDIDHRISRSEEVSLIDDICGHFGRLQYD